PRDAELVLLGHGSPHRHNPVYERLQAEIDAQQLPIHVGVLESTDTPDFPMVLERLQKRKVREVLLAPLLLTSGMHVARDMAGEGEASWKARLEKAGFSVTPILEGLGESPLFRQIYIEKARKALRTE
ncbi:sirohydrochlorin cobaltochelatase, partial [uncultured Mitsuokella sp.]